MLKSILDMFIAQLPTPHSPSEEFDTDPISTDEIARVLTMPSLNPPLALWIE